MSRIVAGAYADGEITCMSMKSRILMTIAALSVGLAGAFVSYWLANGDAPLIASAPAPVGAQGFEVLEGAGLPGRDSLMVAFREGDNRMVIRVSGALIDPREIMGVDVSIEPLPAGTQGAFYWRHTGARQANVVGLPPSVDGKARIILEHQPGWSGSVEEIGLLFQGNAEQAVTLYRVDLVPRSVISRLQVDLAAMGVPETWSQRTINFLANPATTSGFSPTAIAAIVVGFTALFAAILLISPKTRPAASVILAASFVICWILLDIRWQGVLHRNVAQAEKIYAGKDWDARQAAGPDGQLYRYAEELKGSVLPDAPQRIFLVHNSSGHNYARLRLQYHLLPHNIYNFDATLETEFVRPGDYVIFLEKVPGVRFDEANAALTIGNQLPVPAAIVHRAPLGTVFRIDPEQPL